MDQFTESGNEIVTECFERRYVFIYHTKPIDNVVLFVNQMQDLTVGIVREVREVEAGPGKKPAVRITVDMPIECPNESEDMC